MLPPILHNTLLLTAYGSAGGFPLAHKPAFAIGVSASGGGHNPISLLKGYGAKNPHLVWLPFHLIINNIEEFLSALNVAGSNLTSREFQLVSRLEIGIEALTLYAKQLSPIRNELVTLSENILLVNDVNAILLCWRMLLKMDDYGGYLKRLNECLLKRNYMAYWRFGLAH